MGLFDDVKRMQETELAMGKVMEKELNRRFSELERKYKSSLETIQALCSEIQELKQKNENLIFNLAESDTAIKGMQKYIRKQKKCINSFSRNRNFWKQECRAADMLYFLKCDEIEKQTEHPAKIAAAIGK